MAEHVCPWWLGYFLISPFRQWGTQNPDKLLGPYVAPGMTVLEPGPGMGFFTLPLARMVGPSGRVVAVDIQPKMLDRLRRRARKDGLIERIETRLARPDSLAIDDLKGAVDFVLAFAMVHELPSPEAFFRETAAALKPGGRLLLAEPVGHVKAPRFTRELQAARDAGLVEANAPPLKRNLTALFRKN